MKPYDKIESINVIESESSFGLSLKVVSNGAFIRANLADKKGITTIDSLVKGLRKMCDKIEVSYDSI